MASSSSTSSKSLIITLTIFLLSSPSWISSSIAFIPGLEQQLTSALSGLGGSAEGISAAAGIGASMPCMQKLLPCQPFLNSPTPPPLTCCAPLKEMITEQPKCICDVFNNPTLLQTVNITQEDALKLPKACNVTADITVCDKVASPPSSPLEMAPAPSAVPSDLSNNTETSSNETAKSSANGATQFCGYSVIALFMSALCTVVF
ncbi:hypothetical protein ACHQM5_019217 [Ranunculus cassubicifolius]